MHDMKAVGAARTPADYILPCVDEPVMPESAHSSIVNWLRDNHWLDVVDQPRTFAERVWRRHVSDQRSVGQPYNAACIAEIGVVLVRQINGVSANEIKTAYTQVGRYLIRQLGKVSDRSELFGEVVQVALAVLHQRREKFHTPEGFLGYAQTTALRELFRVSRALSDDARLSLSLDAPVSADDDRSLGETLADSQDLQQVVMETLTLQCAWRCLATCTRVKPQDLLVFVLRAAFDMTAREVALRVGRSVDAVNKSYSRARQEFRADRVTTNCISHCMEET